MNEATRHMRLADGSQLTLERKTHGVHSLTLVRGEAAFTANVTGDDLRRLGAEPGAERCANCHFSRPHPSAGWRCHRSGPRKRGDEVFFPRVNGDDWCGKYRAMKPAPVSAVLPLESSDEHDGVTL